jgi:hypothetical protein
MKYEDSLLMWLDPVLHQMNQTDILAAYYLKVKFQCQPRSYTKHRPSL